MISEENHELGKLLISMKIGHFYLMMIAPKQCMIILIEFKNCFMNHQVLKKMEAKVEKKICLGNDMLTVQGTTLLSIQKLWGHQKKWQIPELLSFVSNPLAVINFCFSAILCFK